MGERTIGLKITPALTLLMGIGLSARSVGQPPEPVTSTGARPCPIHPRYPTISEIIQPKIYHALARQQDAVTLTAALAFAMQAVMPGRVQETTA
jgi:hypothetical protein